MKVIEEVEVIEEAESMKDEIIIWRRNLHKTPEIGLNLPRTTQYVKSVLEQLDIEYKTFKNYSGIVCLIGEKEGKTIGLRADMDALPINEEVEWEYKSLNENMHACGHDSHTAMLLGAAKILKKHENELNGKVKLIFQPSEELRPSGARIMIEDGVLENPHVDGMFAIHSMLGGPGYRNGQFLMKKGPIMASDDGMKIKIIGKGGHASMPYLCVDPVSIAALFINNVQYIVSREIKACVNTVISFGSIHGGSAHNIIPNEVYLEGTIRNSDKNTRKYVMRRVEEILDGITKTMGAKYEIVFEEGLDVLENDDSMFDILYNSASKVVGDENVLILSDIIMAAEDASFYFKRIPGCFCFLVNSLPYKDGKSYPLHNSKFVMDDSVLYKGSALLAQGALDFLNK